MISQIKNNKFFYSTIIKITNRIPKKVFYPKSYFEAQDLLKRQDKGENLESSLNKKLASILKESLQNVPFYKDLNLDIPISEINASNAQEVLLKFPIISKNTIMKQPEKFLNQKFTNQKLITRTSGGSTGRGIKICNNLEEILIERAFYDYEWGKFGYKPTSKVVRIGADGIKKESDSPFSYQGDRLLISPYHLNKKWIESIYKQVKNFNVEYFHAYPSSLMYLLQYMDENQLGLKSLKGIFIASEYVDKSILILIKQIFGEKVGINFGYGLTERTNLAWGVFEDNSISYKCEKVYGFSENYIREDGYKELVGTSYWNYVMPLIRYRTEDLGEIENGYVKNLEGRAQEFLVTKTGAKIPGFSISIDQFVWKYVEVFQVVQNEVGKIEFHIFKKDNYNSDIEKKIMESQKEKWGEFFDIRIKYISEVHKTKSGKTKLIINNLNKGVETI
ncbi:phenylacetate--CoA ligase family protein [Bacillus nitratireducens]|uniref:phenylacetate--CoA ligase family protein n=1 Tax=Bacillus nitratireducens TaxID=2026193 RepID=UPI003D3033D6